MGISDAILLCNKLMIACLLLTMFSDMHGDIYSQ